MNVASAVPSFVLAFVLLFAPSMYGPGAAHAAALPAAYKFPTEGVITCPPKAEYLRADSLEGLRADEVSIGPGLRVAAEIAEVSVIDPCDDPHTRDKRLSAYAMGGGPAGEGGGSGPDVGGPPTRGGGPRGGPRKADVFPTVLLIRAKTGGGGLLNGLGQFTTEITDDGGGDPDGGGVGGSGAGPTDDDCCEQNGSGGSGSGSGGGGGGGGCGGCGPNSNGPRLAGFPTFTLRSLLARFSLGMVNDRRDAGVFKIHELEPSAEIASREKLQYDRAEHASFDDDESYFGVLAAPDANGHLRQIHVAFEAGIPNILVDFVDVDPNDMTAGYDINYHYAADSNGVEQFVPTGSPPLFVPIGSPLEEFRRFEVRPGTTGDDVLVITDLVRVNDADPTLTLRGSVTYAYDSNGMWTLTRKSPAGTILRRETLTAWEAVSGTERKRVYSVYDYDAEETDALAYGEEEHEKSFTYHASADPVWRRTKRVVDPGGLELTTEWDYSTAYEPGVYHGVVLKSVKWPDSSWAWYNIGPLDPNDPDMPWQIQAITGERDTAFDPNAPAPNSANHVTTTRIYSRVSNYFRLQSHEEYVGTNLVRKYTYPSYGSREDHADAGTSYESTIQWSGENDHIIAYRRYAARVTHPDKRVDEFENGQLSCLVRETYPNKHDDVCCGVHCANTTPFEFRKWIQATLSDDDGTPVKIAGKSTQRERWVDYKGNVWLDESSVWDGSEWQSIGWLCRDFDRRGRITAAWDHKGQKWTHEYSACCGDTVTGPDGVTIKTDRDFLGRVTSVVREAPGQADITTTYVYAPLSVSVTTTGDDGENEASQTVVRTFDRARRLRSVTTGDGAGRLKRLYDYEIEPGGGWKITTYDGYAHDDEAGTPGTRDRAARYYRDGRLLSVTGASVVGTFYAYDDDADPTALSSGYRATKVATGTSIASPRYETTYRDWLGRVREVKRAGWNNAVLTTTYTYGETTGLLEKVKPPEHAPTLYDYDGLANVVRTILDVDDNGGNEDGDDRITKSVTTIEEDGGAWWRVTRSYVYPPGTDEPLLTATHETRLTGFTGTSSSPYVAVESRSTDIAGNVTVTTVTVDRGAAERVEETTYPDSTAPAKREYVGGRLMRSTSQHFVQTDYAYDPLGRQTEATDARGNTTTTEYDESGRVACVFDETGAETEYSYYEAGDNDDGAYPGRLKAVLNDSGKATYFAYTGRGEAWRTWGDVAYPTENGYDDFGQRTVLRTYRRTDGGSESTWSGDEWPESPLGEEVTTWVYDAASGLVHAKIYDDATQVAYTYHDDGHLDTRTWARSGVHQVTTYHYDEATGEMTGMEYDPNSAMVDVAYVHDRLGRLTSVTDAAGVREFEYDPDTLLPTTETFTDGMFAGASSGDDLRLTQVYGTLPGASAATRFAGLKVGTASDDDAHYVAGYGYDGYGRLNRVTGPGLPGGVSDPDNGAWYRFGGLGGDPAPQTGLLDRIEYRDESDELLGETVWTYEAERDLVASVESRFYFGDVAMASVSKYAYANDNLGRRESVVRSGAAFAADHNDVWGYNDRNELTGSVRRAGTTPGSGSPDHDLDRSYTYDPIGNRVMSKNGELADPNTPIHSYTRNNLNQYAEVTGGDPYLKLKLTHDLDGNLVQMFAVGDVDGDGDVDVNDLSLLFAHLGETCDDNDEPGKLTAAQFARADYDSNCSLDFSPDFTGLLSGYGAQKAINNYVGFTWDAENRLIAVEPLARPIGTDWQRVEFDYDYQGRRIEKRVFAKDTGTTWKTNPTERRRFVWSDWLMLMEIIDIDSASDGVFETTFKKKYTWGRDLGGGLETTGGIGGLLAMEDATDPNAPLRYVYCYDANGNVGQLVDYTESSAPAGIKAMYEYDAYGNVVSSDGPYAVKNTIRFSTKYWDDETGLGYWGYRYYDPRLGRWVSRDPIGEGGGHNLVLALLNNPTTSIDRLGQFTEAEYQARLQAPLKYSDCADAKKHPNVSSCDACCSQVLGNTGRPQFGDLRAYEECKDRCRDPRNWGACATDNDRGNCYDYVTCNPQPPSSVSTNHQPPGVLDWINKNRTCPPCSFIIDAVKQDHPGTSDTNPCDRCPPNTTKIHITKSESKGECDDVHYERECWDGMWYGKSGGMQVDGPRRNPRVHANDEDCGYLCIPN